MAITMKKSVFLLLSSKNFQARTYAEVSQTHTQVYRNKFVRTANTLALGCIAIH